MPGGEWDQGAVGTVGIGAEVSLKLSIVLGSHNGERYIGEQLASIAAQSRLPDELIVTDDESTDATVEIAQRFAETAPFPVCVIRQETNVGFGENFLRGASRASGDIIFFCDQDDVWWRDKLARMETAFEDPEVQLCSHAAELIDEDGRRLPGVFQGVPEQRVYARSSLRQWDVFFGFSIAFRATLLNLLPVDRRCTDPIELGAKLAHDRWILSLATMSGKVVQLSETLAAYRQHGANKFGATSPTIGALVQQDLNGYKAQTQRFLRSTREMVELLENVAMDERDQNRRQLLLDASRQWRRLADQLQARQQVYMTPKRSERIAQVTRNLANGVYRLPNNERFNWRAFAKDGLSVCK